MVYGLIVVVIWCVEVCEKDVGFVVCDFWVVSRGVFGVGGGVGYWFFIGLDFSRDSFLVIWVNCEVI